MSDNSKQTRRTVLRASVAIGLASVAGCVGGFGSTDGTGGNESDGSTVSTTPETPGPFEEITTTSGAIAITLRDGNNVDKINVISPEGEEYASEQVSQGETSVRLPIEYGYQPGKHDILAVDTDEDETIARSSLTLDPALSLEEIGWVYSLPESERYDPRAGAGPNPYYDMYFNLRNNGNAPAFVKGYTATGNPPNRLAKEDGGTSVTIRNSDYLVDDGMDTYFYIPAEKSVTFYTNSKPLIFNRTKQEEKCTDEKIQSTEFTFTILHVTGDDLQQEFEYTYKKETFEDQLERRERCRVMEINKIDGE